MTDEGGSPLTRRRALQALGLGALATTSGCGLLPGAAGRAEEETSPPSGGPSDSIEVPETSADIPFERTLNLADDLGIDPSGEEAIDDVLREALERGTRVFLPEGTYRLEETLEIPDRQIGLVGDGATLRLAEGFDGYFLKVKDVDAFAFSGIDVDMRGNRRGGMRIRCPTKFHIEDVEYVGRGGVTGQALNVATTRPWGKGVVKNVNIPNGGFMDLFKQGNGRIGIWVGFANKGTVRIVDCDIREFGNNGLYASRTPGKVQVEGCYLENNNAADVRISGPGSWVKDTVIVTDHERYDEAWREADEAFRHRPIKIDQAWNGGTLEEFPPKTKPTDPSLPAEERGALVENVNIHVLNTRNNGHVGAGIEMNTAAQSATVRNSFIQIEAGEAPAIHRKPPNWNFREDVDDPPKPHWIHLENVTVTGSAAAEEAVRLVGADGSIVRDCCIHQTGVDRDGVFVKEATDVRIENTNINVTGEPVISRSSDVSTTKVTTDEGCQNPDAK